MTTALQPFTPCLPIRGGKLQSSKPFSSSNPQLPYICSSLSSYINHQHQHANSSSPSINSSVVWREACPNNFNLYASSISSMSSSPYKSRFSMGKNELRANSEERPPTYKGQPPVDNNTRFCGNLKKQSSNYDNHLSSGANSPLIARKSGQHKFWSKSQSSSPQQFKQKQFNTIAAKGRETSPFLYDRRLNKSFETANGLLEENLKCQNEKGMKNSIFRRSSTPQLHSVYYDGSNARDSVTSSWNCCGNFVLKQWKKMNPHY